MDVVKLHAYRFGEPIGAFSGICPGDWGLTPDPRKWVGGRMGSTTFDAVEKVPGPPSPSPDRMDMEALARCSALVPWVPCCEAELRARLKKAEKDLVAVRQAGEYWHAEAQRHEERAEKAEAQLVKDKEFYHYKGGNAAYWYCRHQQVECRLNRMREALRKDEETVA